MPYHWASHAATIIALWPFCHNLRHRLELRDAIKAERFRREVQK